VEVSEVDLVIADEAVAAVEIAVAEDVVAVVEDVEKKRKNGSPSPNSVV
jgi:ABC-type dipeptide/oligopeptide/nickel transport system ATPase subunit